MKKRKVATWICGYIFILSTFVAITLGGSRAVTVISESRPLSNRRCVIIDAGHGGEDGGARSCTGILESKINLQIAMRLNDLLNLLGVQTKMIRTTDRSVFTEGDSIAARKISDLKERVRIVNASGCAFLISIHQNYFSDNRYSGAQVFYAKTAGSAELAQLTQTLLVQTLNHGNNRKFKKAEGIYLMEQIDCTGILVECGFLSNPTEETSLRDDLYQKKLSCVLAVACSRYLSDTSLSA